MRTQPTITTAYRVAVRIDRHPRLFALGVALAVAVVSAGLFALMFGTPPSTAQVVTTSVVESSRDIDGTPMAITKLPDGASVFVEGAYATGDKVTLELDGNGNVIQPSHAVTYWVLLVFLSVGLAAISIFASATVLDRIFYFVDRREFRYAYLNSGGQ